MVAAVADSFRKDRRDVAMVILLHRESIANGCWILNREDDSSQEYPPGSLA
jgi:hypothetical protein